MILLLTGCINPDGMTLTSLNNPEERKEQYKNAIRYYIAKTSFPIVFVENSGTDISVLFKDAILSGRMEYLTFFGNQNKNRGKGYGECEIIQYALNHSNIIKTTNDKRIVKITGRLIIKNLNIIIWTHQLLSTKSTTICAINSKLSFPDSRFIIASESFYRDFIKRKNTINDSKGVYFEHVLLQTIIEEKKYSFSPFYIMPIIDGISGSTGQKYENLPLHFTGIIKYFKYALSQRHKFKKLYRH
jgi:hypothetical protein